MNVESDKKKSIRKVLGQALKNACEEARNLTGESINALPEYFLVVKSADYISKRFKSFTFFMEKPLVVLCEDVGIEREESIERSCRLDGNARADLVLMDKAGKKVKHVVEFKRGLHGGQIKKDALRLAGLCTLAPFGHRMEKNFLVVVSHGVRKLGNRVEDIKKLVEEHFPNVEVKFEAVDISEYGSTRRNSEGKTLLGGVWEFAYKY
ncbi:hypothetical protein ACNFD4_17320 [Pseudomonas sp. NY15367]